MSLLRFGEQVDKAVKVPNFLNKCGFGLFQIRRYGNGLESETETNHLITNCVYVLLYTASMT